MDNNGFGEGEDNADSVMGRGVVLGPNGLASNDHLYIYIV
jgi:hypothetical protein